MALTKRRPNSIKLIAVPLLIVAFFVSGCANDPALMKGQSEFGLSGKSIALLSVRVANKNRDGFPLRIVGVTICPGLERCITRPYIHHVVGPYNSAEDAYPEYLLSFRLDAGTYNIPRMHVGAGYFPLSAGTTVPIGLRAEIKPHSVVYLGHMDVILRERRNDSEEVAGRLNPIGAGAVGFLTGTFDVAIEDKFDEDSKLFASEYPALQGARIEKSILPQWIRPENRASN
jgi:hypothetical protein